MLKGGTKLQWVELQLHNFSFVFMFDIPSSHLMLGGGKNLKLMEMQTKKIFKTLTHAHVFFVLFCEGMCNYFMTKTTKVE